MHATLKKHIEDIWDNRDKLNDLDVFEHAKAHVNEVLNLLDSGALRVAEPTTNGWQVNEWAKKTALLSFRLNDNDLIPHGPGQNGVWYDKVPSKFDGWEKDDFKNIYTCKS